MKSNNCDVLKDIIHKWIYSIKPYKIVNISLTLIMIVYVRMYNYKILSSILSSSV